MKIFVWLIIVISLYAFHPIAAGIGIILTTSYIIDALEDIWEEMKNGLAVRVFEVATNTQLKRATEIETILREDDATAMVMERLLESFCEYCKAHDSNTVVDAEEVNEAFMKNIQGQLKAYSEKMRNLRSEDDRLKKEAEEWLSNKAA